MRILIFGLAALALAPSAALAKIPCASNCTLPTRVSVVGRADSGADAALGAFTVTVRDVANNPEYGTTVILDFWGCPDCAIATDQLDPGVSVGCDTHTLFASTALDGTVRFTVLGASRSAAGTPGPSRVRLYGDGVPLAELPIAIYDLDGVQGLNGADLSIWAHDYLSTEYYGRADYDGDGVVGGADLALWAAAFLGGHSTQSASPTCP